MNGIEDRLREAAGLPDLLAASFCAFEGIRIAARDWEDQIPEMLATFMTAADAAVDGREAITAAPSLPRLAPDSGVADGAAGDGVTEVVDALGALGVLLGERLADGAARAAAEEDREACLAGAAAARRIGALMARDGRDRGPG
jgi:hypothetical protein